MNGPFKLKYNNSAFPFRSPLLDNGKKETEKKIDNTGKGFMRPPYKDTASGTRPYEKRQGYHGFTNFKSILKNNGI